MTRVLVVVGAASAAMTVVVFALAFTDSPSTVIWAVPWVVAYAGGLVAFRSRPHLVNGHRLRVTVSIGVAVSGADTTGPSLIAEADQSMYEQKKNNVSATTSSDDIAI